MGDEPQNNVGMAIGEMKGQLSGVMQVLMQQNVTAAELKKDMAENKKEVMGYLKNTYDSLQAHIKEDAVINNAVLQLTKWQTDTAPKIDTLWDDKNNQKGFIAAIIGISGIVGGAIYAGIEYLKR